MQVVVGDEILDLVHQIVDASEGVAADCVLGDQTEPPFDLVEPA